MCLHGYIVVLEAGDNVRDLGNVGLNREDGSKEPQFFAVTYGTVQLNGSNGEKTTIDDFHAINGCLHCFITCRSGWLLSAFLPSMR